MTSRPRVLVIAEAANPEWVSVPLVGWSLATALREVADVHIVTQIRNREAIVRAGLVEGRDFTAIDSEAVTGPAFRLASRLRGGSGKGWTMTTALAALAYPYFEHLVWKRFGPAIRSGEFDIVHRVTPLSPTAASPIARKCRAAGVPFMLGPLNGGLPWPAGFDSERRKEKEWLSYIRGIYKLLPGRGATLAAASAIIVASRHTGSEMPASLRRKIAYLPENGIDPARFPQREPPAHRPPLRVCFIGRLVPYKGPDMALESAASLLRSGALAFDIIGDGPMMGQLRSFAETQGLQGVRFHGWVDHAEVAGLARQSSLFLFPSIREFGGGAVLEAMAMGLVPLIVDYGGPAELVTDATGFKVLLGSREQIVHALGERLEAIAASPGRLPPMALAAQQRAYSLFTWQSKAQQVRRIYDGVLAGADISKLDLGIGA